MKYILKIFMIAVAMVTAIPSFAVTDKEMEAARTLAAKHYLRYANNGSDYLDALHPTTMGELNSALKPKEKENIKSFNSVSVPKDYASWDKAKLVEYWSSTFFKSGALKEDGKKCLGILAKNLNKMNVGAPAPKQETPAAAETKKEEPAPAAAAPAANAPSADASQGAAPSEAELPADIAGASPDMDAISAVADADAGLADEQPRKSSNTGWYVAILVVLIGVVVWLVMYASKSMKETGVAGVDSKAAEKEIREAKKAAKEELNKMREQYATSLSAKNEEIKQLRGKVESLSAALDAARGEISRERSKRPVAPAQQESAAPRRQQPAPEPAAPAPVKSPAQPSVAAAPARPAHSKPTTLPPVVYLGMVNQRGLFVKASRSLNPESSVYYMDIPDGHHGTYMVVNDPEVLDRVLSDPVYWLGGGCAIENPQDADIANEIVTLEAGEAVFSDNSLKMTKKARIKFV